LGERNRHDRTIMLSHPPGLVKPWSQRTAEGYGARVSRHAVFSSCSPHRTACWSLFRLYPVNDVN